MTRQPIPPSLWAFKGEFTFSTPAILAAVVLFARRLAYLYIVGRRQLVESLTAGSSK